VAAVAGDVSPTPQKNTKYNKLTVIAIYSLHIADYNYTNIFGNYIITHTHPCPCAGESKQGDLKRNVVSDKWTTIPSKILKF
jgi:hypothetical protein